MSYCNIGIFFCEFYWRVNSGHLLKNLAWILRFQKVMYNIIFINVNQLAFLLTQRHKICLVRFLLTKIISVPNCMWKLRCKVWWNKWCSLLLFKKSMMKQVVLIASVQIWHTNISHGTLFQVEISVSVSFFFFKRCILLQWSTYWYTYIYTLFCDSSQGWK